jgi:hypothetical protein
LSLAVERFKITPSPTYMLLLQLLIMKHTSFAFKAIAVVTLASIASLASAAGSNTLTVNASVTKKCTFSTATSTLNFGAIDPSLAGPANATQTSLLYKCTKGTTGVTIAPATGTLNRTLTSTTSAATMPYTLVIGSTAAAGKGFGAGNDLTATLDGSITAANYQNAPAETYKEVVTLNITP